MTENKNEYRDGDKLYVREIRRAFCLEKNDDEYVVRCKIFRRGEHDYFYREGSGYIYRDRRSSKKFWLDDEALAAVKAAAEEYSKYVGTAAESWQKISVDKTSVTVYFRRTATETFDLLCCFTDRFGHRRETLRRGLGVSGLTQTIRFITYPLPEQEMHALRNAPLDEMLGESFGDEQLRLQLRVSSGLATADECRKLEDLTGRRILPPLPEKFNREFIVDVGTIDRENLELLSNSGYRILHRPHFNMKGNTHDKWQLNPHLKRGIDAAPAESEAIPFLEYEALFDSCREPRRG